MTCNYSGTVGAGCWANGAKCAAEEPYARNALAMVASSGMSSQISWWNHSQQLVSPPISLISFHHLASKVFFKLT